jgi:ribose transport system substrate-binding protein
MQALRTGAPNGARSALPWAVAAVLMATSLAACGSDDAGSGSSDTGADATSPIVQEAQRQVAAAKKGRFGALPTSAPKPEPGKSIWWISCGQASDSCSKVADDAKTAAETAGWKMTIFDSKLDPEHASTGIRQAIAAKADAIIVWAFDCAPLKGALQEAKDAGIRLEGVASTDCPGKGLYDGSPQYQEYDGLINYSQGVGELQGWLAIAATDGKAKVVNFTRPDAAVYKAIRAGLEKVIARCEDCEIVDTIDISAGDLAQGTAQAKVQSGLQKNATANVAASATTTLTQALIPALVQSGRDKDVFSVTLGQEKVLVDAVVAGKGLDAGVSTLNKWQAWAAIDDLNRIFAGQKTVNPGIGLQVWTKDQLEPGADYFDTGSVDYRENYKKIWSGTE